VNNLDWNRRDSHDPKRTQNQINEEEWDPSGSQNEFGRGDARRGIGESHQGPCANRKSSDVRLKD
jgi:hypothetical protein